MHRCKVCNGRGVKVTLRQLGPGMVQQMQSICPDCHGEGMVVNYVIVVMEMVWL
jgi:DnaJ family protein A protein 2